MCDTVKKTNLIKNVSGFTLIEIGIALIILGLIFAPAAAYYQQYRIKQDFEVTNERLIGIQNKLGGFKSKFGRYPCPASLTAAPGDAGYGIEDCSNTTVGTCAAGVCLYNNPVPAQNVFVGALPFKNLDLEEREAYDRYSERFVYAVTSVLTSAATYSNNIGGIDVQDGSGNSVITPANSGQFLILSHGLNRFGGVSRDGVASNCMAGSLDEQENCDPDTTYLNRQLDNTFDDILAYFTSVEASEWKVAELDVDNIHLKTETNKIAIGIIGDASDNLDTVANPGLANIEVRANVAHLASGSIITQNNLLAPNICKYNNISGDSSDTADNCFSPDLIAGQLVLDAGPGLYRVGTVGNGMSCYDPGAGRNGFLVGIANNQPICQDEIFVQCPAGQTITGINSNRQIVCDTPPAPRCPVTSVTTFCGTTETLPDLHSTGTASVYSGQCHYLSDYTQSDATIVAGIDAATSGMTALQMIDYANNDMNAQPLVDLACDSGASDALVRDTYRCDSGSYTFLSAHERWTKSGGFTPFITTMASPWPAESGVSYPGDANNNSNHHDCWCREQYRGRTVACGTHYSGTAVVFERHDCPQTRHDWRVIKTDTSNCLCTPGTQPVVQSCLSYYNSVNGTTHTSGLAGNVTLYYDVTCSGNVPSVGATPSSVDTSGCYCPASSPYTTEVACGVGTTNSWTYGATPKVGVASLTEHAFVCPATSTGGIPDPGSWQSTPYSPIPACVCNPAATYYTYPPCEAGKSGTGYTYEHTQSCPSGTWTSTLIGSDCKSCSYKAPASAPSTQTFAPGVKVGTGCACGAASAPLCWDHGSGNFNVWTACACEVQAN